MAQYELLLPKMGESIAEATIIKWTKNPGDVINADDILLEIATDKVDSEVPSPVSGKLLKQLFKEDDVIQVGQVIALIETDQPLEDAAINEGVSEMTTPVEDDTSVSTAIPFIDQLEPEPVAEQPKFEGNRFYSPLVKNIAMQEGISAHELDKIPGTGAEGRLTKDDLINYLQQRSSSEPQATTTAESAKQPFRQRENTSAKPQPVSISPSSGADEIVEMDRMRRLIADHMVMSKHTSPHVTSFVEADVTNLVQWRDRVKQSFEKREGEKITFTPIFVEAVAKAIKELPGVNVSVNGNQIIKKKNINIGMATALPTGNLIVPVIHNADELNLIGLTKAVNDLAKRARNNKLAPHEVQDGTFTITNLAAFGNLMGTPIINQPQVAILAIGVIKKKPAVIETAFGDMIGIRHMMFLSMSYDHRVVDGILGGSFLRKVADYLEEWDVNREV